jgi:hypothetical protein
VPPVWSVWSSGQVGRIVAHATQGFDPASPGARATEVAAYRHPVEFSRIIEIAMQYFVRAVEKHKDGPRRVYVDVLCSGLATAVEEAKRIVLESDRARMLQADACFRNGDQVRTKYCCWIDERGALQERALV